VRTTVPWPLVGECHSKHLEGHLCSQCDGSHEHQWVAWPDAPNARYGLPVRCRICGGRKCDVAACRLRRHHLEDHEEF
jgi:hypothetical protein